MSFKNAALNQSTSYTNNGDVTHVTSRNACLDFFYTIGSARRMQERDIKNLFRSAYSEDRELALRILLWARDIREGAGERRAFRVCLKTLENMNADDAKMVLSVTPTFGRWDDILVSKSNFGLVTEMVAEGLKKRDGLCAKWIPRKGPIAVALRQGLGMTPKQYRKTLVNLTNVVETPMCAKQWDSIDFSKLPSLASARYQKAFARNATASYNAYKESLVRGEAKINAKAVYPYDVLKSALNGDEIVSEEQWKALPNYVGNAKILPLADVSASMDTPCAGNMTCMHVCISLAMYLAEKNTGPFQNLALTFSIRPHFHEIQGATLKQRYNNLHRADWDGNTDIRAAFNTILNTAVQNQVSQEDMPEYLMILSDMEFDMATRNYNRTVPQQTAFRDLESMYANAGYKMPKVIFWNLNARVGNVPMIKSQDNAALISGFSPAIMKSVLASPDTITPELMMLQTVMVPRYDYFK